ncbi:MAG: penicillin-binding protein activator, partial [Planktomarina sp.]
VALLLPKSASDPRVVSLAASAEKAARMAMADLGDAVEMDLRVYDTGGSATLAASAAQQAVSDGAKVIVGPLFADAANAVGVAVADSGVNVLSLSNNVDIAGGNVFVLGNTFQNTADRLVSYAFSQGKKRALIVHAQNVEGEAGRKALADALARAGVNPVGSESYEFTQQGIVNAMGRVASRNRSVGADLVLLTDNYDGGLTLIGQLLPEAGVNPNTVQYAGLSRWDALPSAFNLPGIQGGWFALPNTTRTAQFRTRYSNANGSAPHPLAAIAYDGIAAVGATVSTGSRDALSVSGLTRANGFEGAAGVFRLRADGTIERGLAVATIAGNEVVILSAAPTSFAGAGL